MGMRGVLVYAFFAVFIIDLCRGTLMNCDEVRKVFQLKEIGPVKSIPDTPRTGSDLQVCLSKNQTCCTKKMEERYQVAARRDIENLIQISSYSLKFLISRNVAAFQETVDSLVRQAENHTHAVLLHTYRDLAGPAAAPVGEFFTDVGLFVLGSELSLEEASQRFFDALFPLVYERLVEPDLSRLSPPYAECVRASCRDLAPYGGAPGRLAAHISRASLPGRVFLQALHLGVEVINTTDHIQLSRECKRGLLRMSYCPHCQGLTNNKPCMGYCLNVVRGCLANLAEVDAHWREFVRSLEVLSTRMHGAQDLEQVLLGVHGLVRDAVAHAQRIAPQLSAQVHRVCGHPSRQRPEQVSSVQHGSAARDSIPLKGASRNAEDTLSNRRKEFINSLRLYRAFYGGLADQLCVSDLASGDGLDCWNGAHVASFISDKAAVRGSAASSRFPLLWSPPPSSNPSPRAAISPGLSAPQHSHKFIAGGISSQPSSAVSAARWQVGPYFKRRAVYFCTAASSSIVPQATAFSAQPTGGSGLKNISCSLCSASEKTHERFWQTLPQADMDLCQQDGCCPSRVSWQALSF
ncbi:glypican-5-like [Garra rufa]|uniref:glypican-5-like n=1 Tax=Garra rufa TaxID=137080 RepID=UPI003CCEB6A0